MPGWLLHHLWVICRTTFLHPVHTKETFRLVPRGASWGLQDDLLHRLRHENSLKPLTLDSSELACPNQALHKLSKPQLAFLFSPLLCTQLHSAGKQSHTKRAGHWRELSLAKPRQSNKRKTFMGRAWRASGSFMCYDPCMSVRKIYRQCTSCKNKESSPFCAGKPRGVLV